jgi:hypothetical protein
MSNHYDVYDPATGETTKVYPRAETLPINEIPNGLHSDPTQGDVDDSELWLEQHHEFAIAPTRNVRPPITEEDRLWALVEQTSRGS